MTNLNSRSGLGNSAASAAVAVAAMAAAALAAAGAAAAAGLAVLLATSAAVVTGSARAAGTSESSRPAEPCWAFCEDEDKLSTSFATVLPTGSHHVELDDLPSTLIPYSDEPTKVRKVRFNLTLTTVHEVTPYSEVYGMHPRLLKVQPGEFYLQPAPRRDDRSDSEEEDGLPDSMQSYPQMTRQFLLRALPKAWWKLWPLLFAAFWLRAFGVKTVLETAARRAAVLTEFGTFELR